MNIYWINDENAAYVARLMARVKPDWWDYQGAMVQLMQHNMFGWYMGEKEGKPVGWISVKMLPAYHALYLETFGCATDGVWSAEEKMESLYEYAESFAQKNGCRAVATVMSSLNMNCHEKELGKFGDELNALHAENNLYYPYMLQRNYKAAGLIPDCYDKGHHGILLIKKL